MWTTEQIEATQELLDKIWEDQKLYKRLTGDLIEILEDYKQAKSEEEKEKARADFFDVHGRLDWINYRHNQLFNCLEVFRNLGFWSYSQEEEVTP